MMTENEILELLSDYLDGELDKPTRLQVEEGLRRYPSARKTLEQLNRTVNLLGALPRTPAPANLAASIADKARRQVLLTQSGRRLLAHEARNVLWRRVGAVAAVLAVGCLAAFAVWRAQMGLTVRSASDVPLVRTDAPSGNPTEPALAGAADASRNRNAAIADEEPENEKTERLQLQAAPRPFEPVVGDTGAAGGAGAPSNNRPTEGYAETGKRDSRGNLGVNGGSNAGRDLSGGKDGGTDNNKLESGLGGRTGGSGGSGWAGDTEKKDVAGYEKQYAQNGLKNATPVPSGALVVKGDPTKVYALLKEALLQLEARGAARWSGSLDQLAEGHLPSVTITSDDPLVIEFVLSLLPKSPDVKGIEFASTASAAEEFARYDSLRKARKAAADALKEAEVLALAQAEPKAAAAPQESKSQPGAKADKPAPSPPPGDKRPTDTTKLKKADPEAAEVGARAEPAAKLADKKQSEAKVAVDEKGKELSAKSDENETVDEKVKQIGKAAHKDAPKTDRANASEAKTSEAKKPAEVKTPEVYVVNPEGGQRRYAGNKPDAKGEADSDKDADGKFGRSDRKYRDDTTAKPEADQSEEPRRKSGPVEQAEDPKAGKEKSGKDGKDGKDKEDKADAGKGGAKTGEAKEIADAQRTVLRERTDEVRKLLQALQAPSPRPGAQPTGNAAKKAPDAEGGSAPVRGKSTPPAPRRTITLVLTLQPEQ